MSTWTGTQFVISSDSHMVTQVSADSTNDFLLKANNLSDVPNPYIAKQNLGINVSPIRPVAPQVNDLWVDLDE